MLMNLRNRMLDKGARHKRMHTVHDSIHLRNKKQAKLIYRIRSQDSSCPWKGEEGVIIRSGHKGASVTWVCSVSEIH